MHFILLLFSLLLLCCWPSHATKRPRFDSSGSGARETTERLWQDLSSTTADPETQKALVEVLLMADYRGAKETVKLLDRAVEQGSQQPPLPSPQVSLPLQLADPSSGLPVKIGLKTEVVEIFTRATLVFSLLLRPSFSALGSFEGLPVLVDTAIACLDTVKHRKDGAIEVEISGYRAAVGGSEGSDEELAERLRKLRNVLRNKIEIGAIGSPIDFDNASDEELLLLTAHYLLTLTQVSNLWGAAAIKASKEALDSWTNLLKTRSDLLTEWMDQIIGQLCRSKVPLSGNWRPLDHQNFDEFLWLIAATRMALTNSNRHRRQILFPLPLWPFLGEKAMHLAEQRGMRALFAHSTFLYLFRFGPNLRIHSSPDEEFFWLHSELLELTTIANRPPVARTTDLIGSSLAKGLSPEVERELKNICQLAFLFGNSPELREGQTVVDLATRILLDLSPMTMSDRANRPALDESGVLSVDDLGKLLCWLFTIDPSSGNRHRIFFCDMELSNIDKTCLAAARQIFALLIGTRTFDQSAPGRAADLIVKWQLPLPVRSWRRIRHRLLALERYPMAWNGPGNYSTMNAETLYWAVYALYELSGKVHPSVHSTFFPSGEQFGTFRRLCLADYNLVLILLLEKFFGRSLGDQSTDDITSIIEQALHRHELTATMSQSSGQSHGRGALHSNNGNGSSGRGSTNSSNATGSSTGATRQSICHANIVGVGADTGPGSSQESRPGPGMGNIEPSPGASLPSVTWTSRRTADKILTLYSLAYGVESLPTTLSLDERLSQLAATVCRRSGFVLTAKELESDEGAAAALRRNLMLRSSFDTEKVKELLKINYIALSKSLNRLDQMCGRPTPKHGTDAITVIMDVFLATHIHNVQPSSLSRTTVEELYCFGGSLLMAPVCLILVKSCGTNMNDRSMQSLVGVLRDRLGEVLRYLESVSRSPGTHMGHGEKRA